MTQPRQGSINPQPAFLARTGIASPPVPNASGFERETELAQVFARSFSTDGGRWVWLSELESPNGIADLGAIRLADAKKCLERLALVPPRWTYALRCLPL